MAGREGFTMLEMLVVMVVIGIVMALASPRLDRLLPGVRLDQAARDAAATLNEARGQAIRTNRPVAVPVDVEAATVGGRALPEGISLALVTAASERVDGARGFIRFFADGGATGGGLALAQGDASRKVLVDWLTGDVEVVHGP